MGGNMIVDATQRTIILVVGYQSWSDGFVSMTTSMFDELRQNPEAVFNRLCNSGQFELAEWVMDNFL